MVEYIADSGVDEELDREIRGLLSTCFTKAQDVVFRERRYFVTPYPNRWIIRDDTGRLVAHLGGHERPASDGADSFRIAGICEVCTHPDHRGRGYVRQLVTAAHDWFRQSGFPFSVLFGALGVYNSCGYVAVDNILIEPDALSPAKLARGLVAILGDRQWPTGTVRIPGPKF